MRDICFSVDFFGFRIINRMIEAELHRNRKSVKNLQRYSFILLI
jgi:hypothetical protein